LKIVGGAFVWREEVGEFPDLAPDRVDVVGMGLTQEMFEAMVRSNGGSTSRPVQAFA
jgi:hypothetical protein